MNVNVISRIGKCLVIALALFAVSGVCSASSSGQIDGVVTFVAVTTGSGGQTNTVYLFIDSLDGISWTAVCRRSNSTLGWCSGVVQGNLVLMSGTFSSNTTLELEYLQNKGF